MTRLASRFGGTVAAAAVAAILLCTPSEAYYHYVHFLNRTGPFVPLQEKFDLNALNNKTLTFFVADSGPSVFAANDSFGSVLGDVKQAAAAWNSVDSSDLRVAFGGVNAPNQQSNTPTGLVIFQDLPPGVLGLGTPTVSQAIANGPSGLFFPVVNSVVILSRDTTKGAGPSYLESFYTTCVHEMGHALGLQHTFTSSAMSQGVTRNTSRARPLDADDVAGLSALYPKAGYAATVGSISGRVTQNGQGVNLASVVALRTTGPAVSTMTNPDGTYRIDGLQPDSYYVYVHPIPPTADIRPPVDLNGQPFPAPGPFETLFYPGTRDSSQFVALAVTRGNTLAGVDFSVQPRAAVPIYDVVTYSYLGITPISPAFLNVSQGSATMVARARPPAATPVPQSVQALGGINVYSVRPYGSPLALAIDIAFPPGTLPGTRHLLFNFGNDMYVLPAALNLVQKNPPAILGLVNAGDGATSITGSNFGPDSRVFFDGLPAPLRSPFSGNDQNGVVTVAPPAGFSGQRATVTVFNSDGQNSMFLQSQNPPVYNYENSEAPQVTVTPSFLAAGVATMVDISGVNTSFVDGQVTVGFGTGDVQARQVWVLSPNHAIANVVIPPAAALGASEISVLSGFRLAAQPFAFQTLPYTSSRPSITLPLTPSAQGMIPGSIATVNGFNLSIGQASVSVTVNDQPAQIVFASSTQVAFVIPPGIPVGAAILKLNSGVDSAPPVAIHVESLPPVIVNLTNLANLTIDASRPASLGEVLNIVVTGLDPSAIGTPGRLRVTVSGVEMQVLQVTPGPLPGSYQLQFAMAQWFGGAPVPVVVAVDASASAPYTVTVR